MANTNLSVAKSAKNDEFYTQLSDIENELCHYKEHFKGKIIFCNCDDPTYSNFWKYFHLNFSQLGLKKLISTHFDKIESTYKMEYEGGDDNNVEAGVKTMLEGNGDFRSPECINILMNSDLIVTNPPFSSFREYIAQLVDFQKKFVVIGNMNAITYKDFFPLIKAGKVWGGYDFNKTFEFIMPDNYELKGKAYIDSDGKTHGFVPAITWFTNLDILKRHEPLILYKHYTPEEYPSYDNYDAINVDKVVDIPCDYFEAIGVPISFLDKFCPEQFQILNANDYRKENVPEKSTYLIKDAEAKITLDMDGNPDRQTDRQTRTTYARILIKRITS